MKRIKDNWNLESEEAEAIKIQASAIQAQGGKDYVQLQAIAKWNGILPTVTSDAIPFISINQESKVIKQESNHTE